MNELIDRIAQEAGLISDVEDKVTRTYLRYEEKRFAELIIQTCAELVSAYYDERTMQWAGPKIKQHFKVEE